MSTTKRAHKSEDGLIHVPSPVSDNEKTFLRIHGAVAWGDPLSDDPKESDHAVVIGGEDEAHRIVVFRQITGKFADLLKALVVLKDDLFVSHYHVPPEPEGMKQALHDLNGLTRYKMKGRNRHKAPVYEVSEPESKWSSFRGYDCKAVVQNYLDPFLVDFEASRLKVYELVDAGEVELVYLMLGPLEKIMGQSPGNTIKSPIFRAYIGLVWTLWFTSIARRTMKTDAEPQRLWNDFQR